MSLILVSWPHFYLIKILVIEIFAPSLTINLTISKLEFMAEKLLLVFFNDSVRKC